MKGIKKLKILEPSAIDTAEEAHQALSVARRALEGVEERPVKVQEAIDKKHEALAAAMRDLEYLGPLFRRLVAQLEDRLDQLDPQGRLPLEVEKGEEGEKGEKGEKDGDFDPESAGLAMARKARDAMWIEREDNGQEEGEDQLDPIVPQALELCIKEGRAGLSMIQRRFGIGYTRAQGIMERLCDDGALALDDYKAYSATVTERARETLQTYRACWGLDGKGVTDGS